MINYYKRRMRGKSLEKTLGLEVGSWVNVVDPSPEEIEYLSKKLGLDKRNLESGLDQDELPRLDFAGKDIYIFAKVVSRTEKRKVGTYLIIISQSFILTLSQAEPSFVKRILEGKIRFITTQKLKCLIGLFSLIDEGFEAVTVDIVRNVQAKSKLTEGLGERELKILLEQENFLNNLISFHQRMNLLYERVTRKLKFFVSDKEIIEDLVTESAQRLALCESSLKTISKVRDYYVILLSNKLNRVITILTVVTVIISLPAAISGIYGMNILLPFQDKPYIFYYLLALITVIWTGFILYLRKKKII